MDPNANLQKQREIVQRLQELHDVGRQHSGLDISDEDEVMALAMQLAELVEALDGWLSKGGFLPDVWKHQWANQ